MPWTLFDTGIGPCGIAFTEAGVLGLQLPEKTRRETAERLLAKVPGAGARTTAKATPTWVLDVITRTQAHLEGKPQDLSGVPLCLDGLAPFTAKVYESLSKIPPGRTISYGDLAAAAGSPGASRAVGRAMATNPLPLLVPCHRVLAAGGKPGGFSAYGGLLTKERILALEGVSRDPLFARTASRKGPATSFPFDRETATDHLRAADTVLGAHLAKIGPFTMQLKQTESLFEALAEAIVYQQLNGKAAATIFDRVKALFPGGRLDPRLLTGTSDDRLRSAGLSRNKLLAIRDLADRTATASLPTLAQLHTMGDDAIVAQLTEVRGIGRWTVEMLLMFRLGRPDVLPVADYGIKKGFARLFHRGKRREELPSEEDLRRRGERWRPYRSVASWYLWRAAENA